MSPKARRRGRSKPSPALPFPSAFLERMAVRSGDEYPDFLHALHATPPVSVRVNPLRPFAPTGEPVPWCATGRYLSKRPSFTLDPRFHAGAYYVQEASSMLLEQAYLAAGSGPGPVAALDLCAAPGGKSTHLRTLLPEGSLLVANEPIPARRAILQENLWKWGWPDQLITGMRPADFSNTGLLFDLILVDAPCSGEGLMRRDPFARQQWSPGLVLRCAREQRAILEAAWDLLRPGGALIYSTCTWSPEENEQQVEWLVNERHAQVVPLPDLRKAGVRQSSLGARCMPHLVQGEGFFIAVLREKAAHSDRGIQGATADGSWADRYSALGHQDLIASRGVPLTQQGPAGPVPHPAAAYCNAIHDRLGELIPFQTHGLSEHEAMAFLRGESIPAKAASGWALALHEGLPLGWLKGAGSRWNNHLPPAWRVRMRA